MKYHFLSRLKLVLLLAGCGVGLLTSCDDTESYAELKEKERDIIESFLNRNVVIMEGIRDTLIHVGKINVISEEQFYRQDSLTDNTKNEYVLFKNSGVYMQIISKGAGDFLQSGETKQLICRYTEFNMRGDSVQTTNVSAYWEPMPDVIEASNTSGTISGSFIVNDYVAGAMYTAYNDKSVPSGWLVPLSYVRIGRQVSAEQGIAKVRLIVPHSQGQKDASANVYPCFYEISFQETR